jgi:peptide/nickel transport system substrate-binding protein
MYSNYAAACGFSDGHPFDADDVVFTFQVMLDEKVDSLQRSLLILNGKPIVVRKLDSHRVGFDLPTPYAVAERLFDGFAILPRHLLERPWKRENSPTLGDCGRRRRKSPGWVPSV